MNFSIKGKGIIGMVLLFQMIQIQIYAKTLPKYKIDSIANRFLTKAGSSCIVLGIFDNGGLETYCIGNVNKNDCTLADTNTIFEIGSVSKVFTATAAATEVYDGKLNYSDSLSELFPDIHVPEYNCHEIKIIDLLHHTSGLPSLPGGMNYSANYNAQNPYASVDPQYLIKFISNYTLKQKPGTSYNYSNVGMGLMGFILSKIESKPYEDVIRDKIWMPLHMYNTTVTLSASQQKIMAAPYSETGAPAHAWDFNALTGAGGIRSDLSDMLKFLKASMNPDEVQPCELSEAITDCETITVPSEGGKRIGLGWQLSGLNNKTILYHNGQTGGYKSYMGFLKGTSKGIVILTNSKTNLDATGLVLLNMLNSEK